MESRLEVSLDVAPEVSFNESPGKGHQPSPAIGGKGSRSRNGGRQKTASPGRYLVRSGSVYLFQIRMPPDIAGDGRNRVIRISLGALTAREARVQAELMAAHARFAFAQLRQRRDMQEPDGRDDEHETGEGKDGAPTGPEFDGETPGEAIAEVRGYLKAMKIIVSSEPPPTPPHQESGFEAMRGLVGIAREIDKGAAGNPVIVDNADMLKAQYVAKLAPDQDSGSAGVRQSLKRENAEAAEPTAPESAPDSSDPGAVTTPPPKTEPARREPAEARRKPSDNANTGSDKFVPAYKLDRRKVERKPSAKPPFSVVSEQHLANWAAKHGENHRDIKTARMRRDLFIEFIGDHPVDTYTSADLQAFVEFLRYWPARQSDRPEHMSARQIVAMNKDLHLRPLAFKTVRDGFVGTIKAMVRHCMTDYEYDDPFRGARINYPTTAARQQSAEPLGSNQISRIFSAGVDRGLLDEAMLPLLGHLTGRRLGLLVHLTGNDFRQKFPGVWVARTSGIIHVDGAWKRVPVKTEASMTYFVLHDFLREIGFTEWAAGLGDRFVFAGLMGLADPAKSASSYMARLFERAGVTEKRREVFHSLRGGNIDHMRDNKIDSRDRRLQAGHALEEEHDLYGSRAIGEVQATQMAHAPLMPNVDYSMFRGLDFDKLDRAKRIHGSRRRR